MSHWVATWERDTDNKLTNFPKTGTTCETSTGDVWFATQDKVGAAGEQSTPLQCAPKGDSSLGAGSFPKVAIVGAGISGLTIAYELVRAKKLSNASGFQVDVYERSSYPGGKIVGFFRENNHPVEHSTRIYGVGYVALFDMLKNIPSIHPDTGTRYRFDNDLRGKRCVLDDLVPMNLNFIDITTFSSNYQDNSKTNPYDFIKNFVDLCAKVGIKKSELRHIISKFQTFFAGDYATRLRLTTGLTIGQYLNYAEMSPIVQQVLTSYIGIIVAARVQCSAFAIMNLFECFGVFGSPKTSSELKRSGIAAGNMFPGPSNQYFVTPLCDFLQRNGVRFHFNQAVTDLDTLAHYDAICVCTPHMTTARLLGPEIFPSGLLHNEWSWGMQFYVTKLSDIDNVILQKLPRGSTQNVYNAVLGSPWQLVYAIEYSAAGADALMSQYGYRPLWGTADFGHAPDGTPVLAVITATVSNQYHVGLLVAKSALYCTPSEMLLEVLAQMNLVKSAPALLANEPSFGSVLYVNNDDYKAAYASPEWIAGPLQPNGYRWVSNYTLFITAPEAPSVGCKGMCSRTNMFSNLDCVDVNRLPAGVFDRKANVATHFEGQTTRPGNNMQVNVPATFQAVPDHVYLAGEYCATPNIQIPTMEKACESGKIAAQQLISDFGILDQQRLQARLAGKQLDTSVGAASYNFIPASTAVQVQGLQKTTDLVNFVDLSKEAELKILFYTAFALDYPRGFAAAFVIVIVVVVALALGLGLGLGLKRH
jgi:uncharacterized protein with NAD-binding domain and iron-sulfur cluster